MEFVWLAGRGSGGSRCLKEGSGDGQWRAPNAGLSVSAAVAVRPWSARFNMALHVFFGNLGQTAHSAAA